MSLKSVFDTFRTAYLWCTLDVSGENHVFVCGAPRSGTTLLKAVLESHTQLCGSTYEATCIFSTPDVYQEQWWGRTGLSTGEVKEILGEENNIIRFYDRLAEEVCRQNNAVRFVDKMPWPPNRYSLRYLTSKFEQAQWIHIVRDGRDCYCSAQDHPHVPQSETATSFAKYWQTCVLDNEKAIPSAQKHTVRYEDLTRRPSATTSSIMEAVGLDFEEEQVDPSSRNDYGEGAEGAHRRLQEPISAQSVGRWKDEMEHEEAVCFARQARGGLQRFGYEVDPHRKTT